jgi:hypothetical protein
MARRSVNILGASNSSGAVLDKSPASQVSLCVTVWPLDGIKIVKNIVIQSLTPPSDHISEYFEKKIGRPEWP